MGRVVGIDLGTTTTLVAYWDRSSGNAKIIPSRVGGQHTPSVVRLTPNGTHIVGDAAVRSRTIDPLRTISSAKRLIGRYYSEIADTVSLLAYDVVPHIDGSAAIRAYDDLVSPEMIASRILSEVRDAASQRIGDSIDAAVVGVPAYFTQRQRDATRRSIEQAGVGLARLIIEPVAASLFYNWTARDMRMSSGKDRISVVVDLGGGTYDVTVLGYGDGVNEVLAVNGDRLLGGNDFDERIVEFITDKIRKVHGYVVDPRDVVLQQRILDACIAAKCDLSEQEIAQVFLPYSVVKGGAVYDLSVEIQRNEMESVCEELFERLRSPVISALTSAGLTGNNVHSVMFVGSATRMKRVRNVVSELFPHARLRFANPGEAVALGAAVQAGIIEGSLEDFLNIDAIPFAIGVEDEAGRTECIVPANTSVPVRRSVRIANAVSGQKTIEAHLVQGKAGLAVDNVSLARIVLEGVMPVPRGIGIYRIDVDIDVNCVMRVTLSEERSGLSRSVVVTT